MKREREKLISVPRIPVETARGGAEKCSRCRVIFAVGEKTIRHDTDGRIHWTCLRVGQVKQRGAA